MAEERSSKVVIVGCGPIGGAMGCLFRRHGYDVDIYERYHDIRNQPHAAGRSINLVLTRRGLRFAEMLGVKEQLLSYTVPVYGRTMHDLNGTTTYTPYGREGECNFSVDRSKLNEFWIDEAEKAGASIHFDRALSLEHTSLEARFHPHVLGGTSPLPGSTPLLHRFSGREAFRCLITE
ncbi:hypothetical protein FOZ62_030427 [Perkinsus olseni]|uniref:FAD-binding domain-containing protein n=1 Tax=Perkinsus olseni TaxID=32597 RepID=A0A7J6QGZ0_PEROL|nr:hypothetical protein FOZ62_030427 [Perkinsus olseni]